MEHFRQDSCLGFQRTYEELKQMSFGLAPPTAPSFQRTYEELKLGTSGAYPIAVQQFSAYLRGIETPHASSSRMSTIPVFSVPTRN